LLKAWFVGVVMCQGREREREREREEREEEGVIFRYIYRQVPGIDVGIELFYVIFVF
jgi:hypothetical protein